MIIILVAIVMIVSLAGAYVFRDDYDKLDLSLTLSVIGLLSASVLTVMVIIAGLANFGTEGQMASNRQTYDSLVYQLENDLYDNDNDLGKKELYDQIQEWNEDLARGKVMQRNFWVGCFYPNIYDEFEYIDLSD